ncbi:23S rRNA Uracil-5-methyltransferase [Nitzschia inconspicua]|uniref:23S rRNA Uracil-5-methyltransferase n=1 Tax=Nitzschia inconspicua TaxID=303405 RepID=A0A9K3M3T0_9STRA|nr:23S rRNA Uracil-5-methyltransferase [Nitzschia inconspicua]
MGTNENKKRRRSCPQPGDPDYKTPTQLRNARKRRKSQREKSRGSDSTSPKKHVSKEGSSSRLSSSQHPQDPSLKYIANPKAAPTVQAAKKFFDGIFQSTQRDYQFPIFVGPTQGWRTVARLAVRQQKDQTLQVGLFVPGSHQLLPVPQCQAHHPNINSAVQVLQDVCRQLVVPAFDEATGRGNLRYIAISVERSTGKQQVVLVWKEQESDSTTQILDRLIAKLISVSDQKRKEKIFNLHSLWVHYNNTWKHANSIVDRNGRWVQRHGEDDGHIQEVLLSNSNQPESQLYVPLLFPPQVFRQANLDGFANIVIKIREWLAERLASTADTHTSKEKKKRRRFKQCLELYGGVGTIGLNLVDYFDGLVSSDENPYNKSCFESSLGQITLRDKPMRESRREHIVYHSKSATDMILGSQGRQLLEKAEVIIVDPPRKGLDQEVIDALNASIEGSQSSTSRKALVYVSCGFDAFRRDYQGLVQSGRWTLDHAEGHVLFPGSDAIETLSFFTTTER